VSRHVGIRKLHADESGELVLHADGKAHELGHANLLDIDELKLNLTLERFFPLRRVKGKTQNNWAFGFHTVEHGLQTGFDGQIVLARCRRRGVGGGSAATAAHAVHHALHAAARAAALTITAAGPATHAAPHHALHAAARTAAIPTATVTIRGLF